MTISVIGTVGVPACYGGFESLVENLIEDSQVDYLVYCQASTYPVKTERYNSATLKYVPLKANGIQSIFYDAYSILHSLIFTRNDILVLGVSGAFVLPIFKLASNRKVVTNIDGLEWKRDKWGTLAKRFLKFSEKIAVRFSDTIVADNRAIANYVAKEYGLKTVTIAYGGDHAKIRDVPRARSDFYLALCRIEPENNIVLILEAFEKSEERIKFIGNWQNSDFGRKLKEKYTSFKNIELIEPIYDVDKLFELRASCKGYIHGHSAGGTNPSLVEMMHFGVNTLCFDCDYNRESTEHLAHYFKDVRTLREHLDCTFRDNGSVMSEIACRRYTWDIIRKKYEDLF